MTETEARQVLLVQAFEAGAETPLWTDADRQWATRHALQSAADAPAERFVVERAGHALQRLLPRDPAARRWLERRRWRPQWVALTALLAFVFGAAVDHIGAAQRVDLLAPPVWAVLAWNLAVYLALLIPHRATGLRRWLVRRWAAGAAGYALRWTRASAPLSLARAAVLLHVAAAALALGLVAGMYVRGLVLDYRAGWQSTFLEAPVVQAVLGVLLAPASAVTGIAVPDVAPLRLAAGAPATAGAAPWIHLFATTLALFVVLPRLALALAAAGRARSLRARFPLALDEPYFERLRLQQAGRHALVQVLPYGVAVQAQAVLGLRALLATAFGDEVQLRVAPPLAYGDEPAPEALAAPAGCTLRVVLFDLAATPEAEPHGAFLAALAGPLPRLAVADETAFKRRFGAMPERLAERRAAWQQLAQAQGVGLVCADLDAPELEAAGRALKSALAT